MKYIIQKAYHWTKSDELEITSDGLIYTEIGNTHSGCQCNNIKNQGLIHKKCIKISKLIKEIEDLNKII